MREKGMSMGENYLGTKIKKIKALGSYGEPEYYSSTPEYRVENVFYKEPNSLYVVLKNIYPVTMSDDELAAKFRQDLMLSMKDDSLDGTARYGRVCGESIHVGNQQIIKLNLGNDDKVQLYLLPYSRIAIKAISKNGAKDCRIRESMSYEIGLSILVDDSILVFRDNRVEYNYMEDTDINAWRVAEIKLDHSLVFKNGKIEVCEGNEIKMFTLHNYLDKYSKDKYFQVDLERFLTRDDQHSKLSIYSGVYMNIVEQSPIYTKMMNVYRIVNILDRDESKKYLFGFEKI